MRRELASLRFLHFFCTVTKFYLKYHRSESPDVFFTRMGKWSQTVGPHFEGGEAQWLIWL